MEKIVLINTETLYIILVHAHTYRHTYILTIRPSHDIHIYFDSKYHSNRDATAHMGMFVKTLGLQCCFGLERQANMAPKRCYDAARLCEAADKAAKHYQKLFGCDLVCKYDGVVEGGKPTKEAMVRFSWRVADGAEEKVQLR